jgi:hypothetical protein
LDGGQGLAKIDRFMAANREAAEASAKAWEAYRVAADAYEKAFAEFMKTPGVRIVNAKPAAPGAPPSAGMAIEYPSHLKPPAAPSPAPPQPDRNNFCLVGVSHLLAGETPDALGLKIEAALQKEFGAKCPVAFKE